MRKKRILIVDDEAAFTCVLKLTLELNDEYEVCEENDSCSAVATGRRFVPDIILLDVVMPIVDGGEVHRLFKLDPILNSYFPLESRNLYAL
jgi:CheY-like chemotaxis protein